jgi:MFS family permease
MELVRYLRAHNWPVAAGYAFFGGMMALGYLYNVTFIQLGLPDLGVRVLGMSRTAVATQMALLALVTCVVALLTGRRLSQRGRATLMTKLSLSLGVVAGQTALTAVAPAVPNPVILTLWIVVCSVLLGVAVPATFSLATDLIPVRDRGYVAAAITALAYFLAATLAGPWRIEPLSRLMLLVMIPGLVVLGGIVLAARTGLTFVAGWVAELALNHRLPRFGRGRFVEQATGKPGRAFWGFVALMFGIFFIDSLGFLRIIDTPILVDATWQAAALAPRLTLGVVHVLAAVVAGVLYTHLNRRHLFFWVFGIFALTHLSYTFRVWLLPETTAASLGVPALYATAVSLYTVVNFALWTDFSTPVTAPWLTAVGVALSGWAATFLSTALAIQWQTSGVPLETHLRAVNALAQVFFLAMLVVAFWSRDRTAAHRSAQGG